MDDHGRNAEDDRSALAAPRRGLFGRLVSVAAVGFSGLTATPARAAASPAADGPSWPGKLKARHRQVVDATWVNDGAPLEYAHNFLATNPGPGAALVVVILRAGALPIAVNDTIWEKYKIGEAFKITDPETKAPAVKNPFLRPKPGVLRSDDGAVDRLLAAGAIFGACDVALHGQSKRLSANAGVSAEDAAKEWAANVIPGITIIPAGVWGVNRAQEAGCTYCGG
jgi:hypothetical protein